MSYEFFLRQLRTRFFFIKCCFLSHSAFEYYRQLTRYFHTNYRELTANYHIIYSCQFSLITHLSSLIPHPLSLITLN